MGGVGPGGPGAGGSEGGSSGGVASRAAGRQPLPSSALARPASPSGAGAQKDYKEGPGPHVCAWLVSDAFSGQLGCADR